MGNELSYFGAWGSWPPHSEPFENYLYYWYSISLNYFLEDYNY